MRLKTLCIFVILLLYVIIFCQQIPLKKRNQLPHPICENSRQWVPIDMQGHVSSEKDDEHIIVFGDYFLLQILCSTSANKALLHIYKLYYASF